MIVLTGTLMAALSIADISVNTGSSNGWSVPVNTFLLIITMVLANRNRKTIEAKSDETLHSLRNGTGEILAEKVADAIISRIELHGDVLVLDRRVTTKLEDTGERRREPGQEG